MRGLSFYCDSPCQNKIAALYLLGLCLQRITLAGLIDHAAEPQGGGRGHLPWKAEVSYLALSRNGRSAKHRIPFGGLNTARFMQIFDKLHLGLRANHSPGEHVEEQLGDAIVPQHVPALPIADWSSQPSSASNRVDTAMCASLW